MATTSEIIQWVAGFELDRDPGDDDIPSETDLDRAFDPYSEAGRKANECLCALWPAPFPAVSSPHWATWIPAGSFGLAGLEEWGLYAMRLGIDDDGGQKGEVLNIEAVHAAWLSIPEADRPRHPLAPLVREWFNRPANRDPFDLRSRASVPRLHRIEPGEAAQLPAFPGSNLPEPGRQLDLPGFGPTVEGCPSWLLWLFDAAGGESMKQGRGAPLAMRLFVGALLHVAVPDRTGNWVALRFPTLRRHEADWPVPGVRSVETWLHPEAWGNFRRDWTLLPAALDSMRERLCYVPVPGVGSMAMVFPSVIPRAPCDPMVEFTVRIPASAAHGARADWQLLCRYGAVSAPLYRAYLSTVAYFDHSARAGHPITADIAARS